MRLVGSGDPERVPPEVVAILGDARFRLPETGMNSWMAQDLGGQFLAVPNSNRVAIFDAPTGLLVRTLTAHPEKAVGFNGRAYAVAFSPDGKYLAASVWEGAGDKDRNSHIKVWDLATGNETATLSSGAGWVWSLAFSPDGKHLLSGCDKGTEVWDLATGKAAHSFPGGHVWQLGVSPDGKKAACCDPAPKTVPVFNPQSGERVGTLEGFADVVRATAFSPDGKWLATGNDTELLLWDAEKLQLVKKIDTPAGWVAFEPGGKTLLTASHDQTRPDPDHVVTRWHLKTWQGTRLPSLSRRQGWTAFQLSPDGRTLFSVVVDGRDTERFVRAYDALTGRVFSEARGHAGQVMAVAFSPDGKRLASVSLEPGVRIWHLTTGQAEIVLPNEQGFFSVAFSADGKWLAAGEADGAVVLYDARTGARLRTLPAPRSQVRAVAFSPDGTLVAGTTQPRAVTVWEVATGRVRHTLPGRKDDEWGWSLAFSPDGKTLATGWGIYAPQSAGAGEVILFEVASGWEVADLQLGLGQIRWLGFHPNGRSLGAVVANGAGRVMTSGVWDLTTRQPTRKMAVPASGHLGGAWRADGLLMASSGYADGTVRLWNTDGKPEREQVIQLYPPGTHWLHGMSMSPEGRHLATANPDGTITILRLARPGEVFEVKTSE
jgi:WD40 repeat protein